MRINTMRGPFGVKYGKEHAKWPESRAKIGMIEVIGGQAEVKSYLVKFEFSIIMNDQNLSWIRKNVFSDDFLRTDR